MKPSAKSLNKSTSVGTSLQSMRTQFHPGNVTPLFIAKPAPKFSGTAVVDGVFKEIKLSDFIGKYLVLLFYPLDFNRMCPAELIMFSDRLEEFREVNCDVVACSTDSQYSHLAWADKPRLEGGLEPCHLFLLADHNGKTARSYGVLKEDDMLALRALFIIDSSGVVRQVTVNDLPVIRSVSETLRLVQAFQFADVHGEVCPANWHPGDHAIVPEPVRKA